jgi:hypothetical protein
MKHLTFIPLLLLCASTAFAQTHGETRKVCVTPTVDTGAYAPGDNIGGLLTFPNALTGAHGGLVQNALLVDQGAEGKQVELCIFDTIPSASTFTDQAAQAIADASLSKIAGCGTFADFSSFSNNGIGQIKNLSLSVAAPTTTLYGVLIDREAVTYDAAGAVSVCITVIED